MTASLVYSAVHVTIILNMLPQVLVFSCFVPSYISNFSKNSLHFSFYIFPVTNILSYNAVSLSTCVKWNNGLIKVF